VIGDPGIPIRILLHGKEGAVGLMPAHGESMSDEEIAAVLTYVRRAWGQTASPVDSASVQQIRAATAGRTRAWTPAELGQIATFISLSRGPTPATCTSRPLAARLWLRHRSA
jgi:hypothetical protein